MDDLYAWTRDAELAVAREQLRQAEVAAVVDASRRRLDAIASATAAVLPQKVACRRGCGWCCHFRVAVRADEALRLAVHIRETFSPERQAEVQAAAEANAKRFRSMTAERRMRTNAACPLLVDGACSVYAVRPHCCRAYHATDVEGCEASYADPERSDIPEASVPELTMVYAGHDDGLLTAMEERGLDLEVYELNAALAQAMADGGSGRRYEAGELSFPGARFED